MNLTTEQFKAFLENAHDAGSIAALVTIREVIDGLIEKLDAESRDREDPS